MNLKKIASEIFKKAIEIYKEGDKFNLDLNVTIFDKTGKPDIKEIEKTFSNILLHKKLYPSIRTVYEKGKDAYHEVKKVKVLDIDKTTKGVSRADIGYDINFTVEIEVGKNSVMAKLDALDNINLLFARHYHSMGGLSLK